MSSWRRAQSLLTLWACYFDNYQNFKLAGENVVSVQLVAHSKILTLEKGCSSAIKLELVILGLGEFYIKIIHSQLACPEIYLWGPDLTQSAGLLYVIACWLAALNYLHEVALNSPHSNFNNKFVNNMTSLTPGYNHFVHYPFTQKSNSKTISPEKFQLSTMRAVTSRRRKAVSNPWTSLVPYMVSDLTADQLFNWYSFARPNWSSSWRI